MATECFQSLQGLAIRVTRLDSCGAPVSGSGVGCDYVAAETFTSIDLSPVYEDADEFLVKNAGGKLDLNQLGTPTLKRYELTLSVCTVDPDLFNIISGVTQIMDFNGDIIGYEVDQNLGDCNEFALEWWSRVPGNDCVDPITGETKYIYWLLPKVTNGRIGDVTIENGILVWTLIGEAIASSSWGVGPFDVVATDALNTAGPLLAPISDGQLLHVQVTTIPPPLGECGCSSFPPPAGYVDIYDDIYA